MGRLVGLVMMRATSLVVAVVWGAAVSAAPPVLKKEKPAPGFPRVERYVEEGADAKQVKRCVVPVDRTTLLAEALQVLPDFKEPLPDTTLATFFKALDDKGALRKLLPTKLDGVERSASLLNPTFKASSVTIVWLDENHWFVGDMFYRFKSFEPKRTEDCTAVLEGSLRDFITYSPLINARREDLPFSKRPALVGSGIEMSNSPGMPNSTTFSLRVEPSGRFGLSFGGYMPSASSSGFDPHRLTALLVKARNAGLEQPQPDLPEPEYGHDQQRTTLRLWLDGRRTEIQLAEPAVTAFAEEVLKAYEVNKRPARPALGEQ